MPVVNPPARIRSDEMLGPEVGPQVHDLPHPQRHQQKGGAEAEPLDAVVGALVGVSQLLLARPQVVHLADDLGDHLLDAAEVGLDGLQLLGGLDGGPVLRVGADVDVEFHVAGGVVDVFGCRVLVSCKEGMVGRRRTSGQDILEADVKGCVGQGGKDGSLLAGDVLRFSVLVAHGIHNL